MRRTLTIWFLLLAVTLPLAQPAAGTWHCPDGKLCVAGPGGRYHCLAGACHRTCCAAAHADSGSPCCHGAFPALVGAAGRSQGPEPGIDAGCRFTLSVRVLAAAVSQTRSGLFAAENGAAIPSPAGALTAEPQRFGFAPAFDPSPPPASGLPPTGFRAPPFA